MKYIIDDNLLKIDIKSLEAKCVEYSEVAEPLNLIR